jgi:hypothetical protein
MTRKAVLFSEMTPGASWEDEFNHWYDAEHIPPRMEVPGFINAQRYRNVDGPAYLALYNLEDRGLSFVLNMRMQMCVGWLIDAR